MDDQNIKKVLSLFSTMEDCEKAMSEYYLACSVLTADHYEFCVGLSIESGSVTLKQALQASAELEGTLIETSYFEIITSENRKYLELAEKITSANNRHRESLLSKIADISQQKD